MSLRPPWGDFSQIPLYVTTDTSKWSSCSALIRKNVDIMGKWRFFSTEIGNGADAGSRDAGGWHGCVG